MLLNLPVVQSLINCFAVIALMWFQNMIDSFVISVSLIEDTSNVTSSRPWIGDNFASKILRIVSIAGYDKKGLPVSPYNL